MLKPYQKFGKVLHSLRRTYHTTKKELCAALEIDEKLLIELEAGEIRPSEDLIELMIGHFSLEEHLADNLWVLAGYPLERLEDVTVQIAQMPISELKISYTDMVHISVNNFGVVLNFMQNVGSSNQPMIVSRLGMSKEHAKSVADIINKTLKVSNNKNTKQKFLELPSSTVKSDTSKN